MKKLITVLLSLGLFLVPLLSIASDMMPTKTYHVDGLSFEIPVDTEEEHGVNDDNTYHFLYPLNRRAPERFMGGMVYIMSIETNRSAASLYTFEDAEDYYTGFFSAFEEREGYHDLSAATYVLGVEKYLHHRVFTELINGSIYHRDLYCFIIDNKVYCIEFTSVPEKGRIIPPRIKPLILKTLNISDFYYQNTNLSLSMLSKLRAESNDPINSEDYKPFEYKKIARNPYDYIGEPVSFTGEVIQVMEHDLDVVLRVKLDNEDASKNEVIYVDYVRSSEKESRILEYDHVRILGVLDGLETYSTVISAQASIPRMIAYTIELLDD